MTYFRTLLIASGLSGREAADFLDVKERTIRHWKEGQRDCPDGVINEFLPAAKQNCEFWYQKVCAIEENMKK